ncbi:MAG: hypothetical protein CMG14_04830 [Candidatus Marinimicrobia bacterium]|nr:hypothetical protein [Candidatus Neomarinimicrobiota bacterium]
MKNFTKIFLMILMVMNLSQSQNAELISQQITIENAIKNKVDAVINKFLKPSEYLTIVNARLDFKPLSLKSVDQQQSQGTQSSSQYSVIPGLMPSIPTEQSLYKQSNQSQDLSFSGEKYILYQLEIIIYLDESVSTGSLQTNLSTVVMQNLKEVDCENCIRFETLELPGQEGGSVANDANLQSLLDEIDSLKETMRNSQLEIKDSQINELEDINAKYLDEIQGFQDHLKEQDRIRQEAEELRMARLEENERNYRAKQDSLYVLTSIKLDEAVRGRIQSEETTKKELLNVIKMQIQGEEMEGGVSDNTQSDLFTKTPSSGKSGMSSQMWLMILILILLLAILLVVILKGKQTVYLKPKNNNENNLDAQSLKTDSSNPVEFVATQANENDDVKKTELQSLRQKAVSMSVSEKAGANQIVQDWLGDTESEESDDNQDNQKEEE